MILEERDYRMVPGRTAQFLAVYEEFGLPVQKRYLGEPVGFFVSDIGELNHVVALWKYESYDDRSRRRAFMQADPDWLVYLNKIVGLIDTQQNRILVPTSFSPAL